jgi:hypothetical protein
VKAYEKAEAQAIVDANALIQNFTIKHASQAVSKSRLANRARPLCANFESMTMVDRSRTRSTTRKGR